MHWFPQDLKPANSVTQNSFHMELILNTSGKVHRSLKVTECTWVKSLHTRNDWCINGQAEKRIYKINS